MLLLSFGHLIIVDVFLELQFWEPCYQSHLPLLIKSFLSSHYLPFWPQSTVGLCSHSTPEYCRFACLFPWAFETRWWRKTHTHTYTQKNTFRKVARGLFFWAIKQQREYGWGVNLELVLREMIWCHQHRCCHQCSAGISCVTMDPRNTKILTGSTM